MFIHNMRRSFVLALIAATALVACHKNSPTEPAEITTPSGGEITSTTPKIKLTIAAALNADPSPGRCYASAVITGTNGSDDLMKGLPVESSVDLARGEHWDGSWIRAVDWGYNPKGAGNQSGIPFVPGTRDHFTLGDIPFDCTKGPDWTFQIAYGGQTMTDPKDPTRVIMKPNARLVAINFNAQNMVITMPRALETFYRSETDGMVHLLIVGNPF